MATITDRGRVLLRAVTADRSAVTDPPPDRRRVLVVIAFLIVGAPLLGISLSVTPGDSAFYPLTIALCAVWAIGAFASGTVSLGGWAVTDDRPDTGNPRGAAVLGCAAGIALGAVFAVGALVTSLIPPLTDLVSSVIGFAGHGNLWLVILITVGNGIAEELFFRGAVYSALRDHHPAITSTVVYALATAASGNVMLCFAAVVLGAVCAVLRRATGGVLAPACTHVVWQLVMLTVLPPIFGT